MQISEDVSTLYIYIQNVYKVYTLKKLTKQNCFIPYKPLYCYSKVETVLLAATAALSVSSA